MEPWSCSYDTAGEEIALQLQQQALLQIYEDFCLADGSGCEDCPSPGQMLQ